MATIVTAIERFLDRMKVRKCENDHVIPVGVKFCPECGKAEKLSAMSESDRITELEQAFLELLNIVGTPSKKDDSELGKKIAAFGKYLVTPKPKTEKK